MGLPGRNGAWVIGGEQGGGTENSAEPAERLRQSSRLQGTLEHPSVQVASRTYRIMKNDRGRPSVLVGDLRTLEGDVESGNLYCLALRL